MNTLNPKQPTTSRSVPNSSFRNNSNSEPKTSPENKILVKQNPNENPLNSGLGEMNGNHEKLNTPTDQLHGSVKVDPEGPLNWNKDGQEPVAQKPKANCCCSPCPKMKAKLVTVMSGCSLVFGLLVLTSTILCSTYSIIHCHDTSAQCSHQMPGVNAAQLNILGYGSGMVQIITSIFALYLRKQPAGFVAMVLCLIASESLLVGTFVTWFKTCEPNLWSLFLYFRLFIVIIAVDCGFGFLSLIVLVSCMLAN